MSGEGEYVCTLTPASLKKAEKELFEVPADRLSAVQTLRDWIHQQPHIHFPTDTATLLMYLRGAKFSQVRAREVIENNLRLRVDMPSWLCNVNTKAAGYLTLVENDYILPLPKRDPEGRAVVLFRSSQIDPKNPHHSVMCEMRLDLSVMHWISMDENVQVNGQVLIFDFTGYTLKHLSRDSSQDAIKFHKAWQDSFPARMKMIHLYNMGSFMDGMMAIMKPFTKKKYLERMCTHNTMESLYKHVPMEMFPREYLPDDYTGPNAGSMRDISENLKNELLKPEFNQEMLELTSDKYYIDNSKKPKDIPTEHFRKLNVD